VDRSIHVRFNDNKPEITMLELDRSFAEMKIENIVKSATSSSQAKHTSNSSMDNQHEEVKEPTGPLLRKHLPES